MNRVDYENWLKQEVAAGGMTQEQMDDLLSQKVLFDDNRQTIEKDHKGWYVGYVSGQMIVDRTFSGLSKQAKKVHEGSMLYFEPVGFSMMDGSR
jgi:hypothetical protein